ncbi:MAG TPA: alpha/beta hydrolase family protein [Pyrinomonadaceae bacterium]|jgi:putative lysine transport system ATP-binding protein
MRKELPFRAILPEESRKPTGGGPVLYLLHGLFGNCDNWFDLTDIKQYLFDKEIAAVLPDGGDAWYTNGAIVANDKFETSFIDEFIPTVEKELQIGGSREKRAVAGLSMGGFGALKFGLKYPDSFVFAGSMSGAFDAPRLTENNVSSATEALLPSVSAVFGDEKNPARAANDLFEIVRRISAREAALTPFLYLDCGTEDGFLEVNRNFSKLLRDKNLSFRFEEAGGGHDWIYWNRRLEYLIDAAGKILDESKTRARIRF